MKQLSTRHNRAGSVTRIRQFSFSGLAQIGVLVILLSLSICSPLKAQEEMNEMVDAVDSQPQPPKVKARSGDLDTSFGGDGIVATAFGTESSSVAGVAIQKDGKVVVVGTTTRVVPGILVFAVARYNPNGTLDTTFGSNGKTTTSSEGGFSNGAAAVAIQADGKIVVAGQGGPGADDFSLVRYNTNGTLDTTFGGGDGKVLTNFDPPGSYDAVSSLAIQGDGKIVVGGSTIHDGVNEQFAVARYNPNGSLDTTFDGDGMLTTEFPDTQRGVATSVKIQANGRIVVAGYVDTGTWERTVDIALARYNSNGTLDTSFDGDGMLLANFGESSDVSPGTAEGAAGLAIQPDGKIVVAGTVDTVTYDYSDPDEPIVVESNDFGVARFLPNGAFDNSFSGDGKATADFGNVDDHVTAVALQVDGKIVTVGYDSTNNIAITRHNPNGTLDKSFSGDGMLTTELPDSAAATAVAIQPKDGRIVVAGTENFANPGNTNFVVARYHAIVCGGFAATRVGTPASDTLRGTTGDDVIFGAGGDDRIFGLNGDDVLCGGSGNDTLFGGGGFDICDGGSGEDEEHGCEIVHSVP